MIPLSDDNPRRSTPIVVIGVIAACALAFFYQLSLGDSGDLLVLSGGLIPAEISHLRPIHAAVGPHGELMRYPPPLVPLPFTVFTSMFLHGGWMHLIGNMWFLWLFGDNVEDILGRPRFVVFYLLSGIAAATLQVAVSPDSTTPMIGASGAIAGVLGGYARVYPRARVRALVPLGFFSQVTWLPASLFLGLWFVMQLFSAFGGGGGVAWYAHVGGFVFGLVTVRMFVKYAPPKPWAQTGWDE